MEVDLSVLVLLPGILFEELKVLLRLLPRAGPFPDVARSKGTVDRENDAILKTS